MMPGKLVMHVPLNACVKSPTSFSFLLALTLTHSSNSCPRSLSSVYVASASGMSWCCGDFLMRALRDAPVLLIVASAGGRREA